MDEYLDSVADLDRRDDLGDWTRPLLKLIVLSRNNAPADLILREADALREFADHPAPITPAIVRVGDAAVTYALTRHPDDRREVDAALADVLRLHPQL